ncbi:TetR family transcriptional regulator [Microbacterium sp. A82]|uniref:acyl-CoA-like ligand-binding transcription factor n=1 Tax=Microbacterium sp. A82 TaxID=3450452 RepID=UPI003F3B1337
MEQHGTRIGRPPKAEPEVLRGQLLDLIALRGYENVSMGSLAETVGMSVRTLHRYFPTKADIVWGGIEVSVDALTAELDAAAESSPIVDAVAHAITNVFARNVEDLTTMRARLRLIALSPELRTNRSSTFEGWRHTVIHFVATRRGEPAQALIPVTAGAAIHTAVIEALHWWGLQEDPRDPAECITQALHGLSNVNNR